MAEPLRIVCPCGYENWVPEEKRGQVVPCFICGEDLLVEEASENTIPTAPSSAQSTTPTPSNPRPRSPFEEDDLETAVRPKFQHAPPEPTAPVRTARPRSPFEADAPDEPPRGRRNEENFVADPFSRELIPAPKPAPSTADEMEKHRPTDQRRRHVFIDSISPHDAPTGEKCMQCGRPLRGSWDRVETHLGVFCYICSNQATQDVPERIKAGSGRRAELQERDLVVDPVNIRNAAPLNQPGLAEDSHFKKMIFYLACGCLLFTFIVWLTGWGTPDPDAVRSAAPTETRPAPYFFNYIIWGYRAVAGFAGTLLAIYLTLDRSNNLPHDFFWRNLMYIGAVVVFLAGVATACFVVLWLLSGIFVAGKIWGMMVGVLFVLGQLIILINWLDFKTSDFLWLYFFYLPVSQFLLQGIGALVGWGLYELAM